MDDDKYGSLQRTTDLDVIQDILDFQLEPGASSTGTADFCDWDACNNNDLNGESPLLDK